MKLSRAERRVLWFCILAMGLMIVWRVGAEGTGGTVYLPMVERAPERVSAYVERVIDGDSFLARVQSEWPTLSQPGEGQLLEINLLGANAPRLEACYGQESKGLLMALIENQWVEIEFDQAQTYYGDFYAHVWYVDRWGVEKQANIDSLRLGASEYAWPWPAERYRDAYGQAQAMAQTERLGIWGECAPYPVPTPWGGFGPYPYPLAMTD